MHFAMPPRKSSPAPYPSTRSKPASSYPNIPTFQFPLSLRSLPLPPILRRDSKLRTILLSALSLFTFVYFLRWVSGAGGSSRGVGVYPGAPEIQPAAGDGKPVVIVTVFSETDGNRDSPGGRDGEWMERIRRNRVGYAERHGYTTFFTNTTAYPLKNAPGSWAKVPALRHAMTLHPHSTWFWYLDSTSLITNQTLPLTSSLLSPQKLESLMIVNEPVVPPDSVIKTFANLKGERIDIIVSQDKDGLSVQSLVVRRGEWAKYFLDAWFDPIYRSYNFQKAECHALEHIVQWHGTILAKLALVPQNVFNSYAKGSGGSVPHVKYGKFTDGDLVAGFPGCERDKRSCKEEMRPLMERLDMLDLETRK